MRIRFIISVILVSVLFPSTTRAQSTPCDPAKVIAVANALKSGSDQAKDLAALVELAKSVAAEQAACAPKAEYKLTEKKWGDRKDPIPLGEFAPVEYRSDDVKFEFNVGILEVLRGAPAVEALKAANELNGSVDADKEWLLAKVGVKLTEGPSDKLKIFSRIEFKMISNNRIISAPTVFGALNPDYSFELYAPAEAEGWIAFHVFTDDLNPTIVFGQGYDGSGGYYFKVTP